MKAVQFAEYGGPNVLRVVEIDEPHAGSGQVRIAVRAAGVNAIDWKIRAGYMGGGTPPSQPSGTGIDAAGVVDEVGEGIKDVAVGDEVFGSGSATLAEKAVLSSWAVKPDGLSFEEAAGYLGAVATTYDAGLVDRVRSLAPERIDAALDIAGSGVIPELIELTGDPSKVLSIADFGAPEHGAQVSTNATNTAGALAEAARLFTEGAFRIPVEKTFPLAKAAEAQKASEAGHVTGKFVVTIPQRRPGRPEPRARATGVPCYGISGASSSKSAGILTGLPVARSMQAWRVWPVTSNSPSLSTS